MLYRRVQPLIHYSNKFAQIIHIRQVIYYLKVKGQQPNLQFLLQKFKFESTVQSNNQG
jgi:hypothetical protein